MRLISLEKTGHKFLIEREQNNRKGQTKGDCSDERETDNEYHAKNEVRTMMVSKSYLNVYSAINT
jgi:hypothetical protein